MMDTSTGEFAMLDDRDLRSFLNRDAEPPPGKVLMFGTEQQMRQISRAVKVGNAEIDKRKAKRKQQRASRKRNR